MLNINRRETFLIGIGLLIGLFVFVLDQASAHGPIVKQTVESWGQPVIVENTVGVGSNGVEMCPLGRMIITNYGYNTIHWKCIEQEEDEEFGPEPIPTREAEKQL